MLSLEADPRIYVSLERLIALRVQAQKTMLPSKLAKRGIIVGPHQSRARGRGMDFEELRGYRIGDDIRSLDWKVSNRTKKPHVRVYAEEKERNVVMLIDQRSSMFFASQHKMKSVVAAELAALQLWRTLALKDRIGVILFNDQSSTKFKPSRQQANAMRILDDLVHFNQSLNALTPGSEALSARAEVEASQGLNQALTQAQRLCHHDCVVYLISDLYGWNEESIAHLKRMRQHNDVVVYRVSDAMEMKFANSIQGVVSNAKLQMMLKSSNTSLADKFDQHQSQWLADIRVNLRQLRIPALEFNTNDSVETQWQTSLLAGPVGVNSKEVSA